MRREHDYYPTTHEGATLGLLNEAPIDFDGTVFECCSGQHHMTNVLLDPHMRARSNFRRVLTNDVVPSLQADFHEDARDERVWREVFTRQHDIDWVITNPPFSDALAILRNALKYAKVGVAFYLRISFWEPTNKDRDASLRRGPFLRDNPPTGFMPMSRISHTEDGGTDSATCAWFVWQRYPVIDGAHLTGEPPPAQWHRVLILDEDAADDRQPNLLGDL